MGSSTNLTHMLKFNVAVYNFFKALSFCKQLFILPISIDTAEGVSAYALAISILLILLIFQRGRSLQNVVQCITMHYSVPQKSRTENYDKF